MFHTDSGIGGEVRGGTLVGGVELLRQGAEFRLRRFAAAEGTADLGPQGFPLRALQQSDAWIAPALTASDKHVTASQTVLQALHQTQGVRASIGHGLVAREDEASPGTLLDLWGVSTISNAPLLKAVFQAECDRPAIRRLPDTGCGVPSTAGLFDLSLQCHLVRTHTDAN